ncbi:MAG: Blue (Type 1) copper domain protein [Candidatus Curtissbacteria bacterium GW2011_GWA1_40_9]|uniref:Blue (Type 1) copper domain protein n=1 Tax=Candidatus Curtissbacteria bacterium GW2011_GWA1_40_9 TaxID=1618408 RepID=A0A0G0TMQ2_9BACT|nr:MAG: Blue (Type 1) copper domain protein [Candidatus Curtissbacteria bacterium GW2011_GWA1_40_9]
MNKFFLLGGISLLAIVSFVGWQTLGQKNAPDTQNPPQTFDNRQTPTVNNNNQFQTPKKSAHYESNTPAHGATLAGVPVNVVIDFNFDLAKGSSISITYHGKESGVGQTLIDSNPLAMRRNMDPTTPDGLYTVNYKACWADESCHDGSFQFAIDRSKASGFFDMRNKKEVTVSLKNTAFNHQSLRVSAGTKVTWVNEDDVVHTVNTDSHPAHSYFTSQNSRNLQKSDEYSVTFEKVGIYPYHCTPHAGIMTGSILVE